MDINWPERLTVLELLITTMELLLSWSIMNLAAPLVVFVLMVTKELSFQNGSSIRMTYLLSLEVM